MHGYDEVTPLDENDRVLLAPALWPWVLLWVADSLRRMRSAEFEPHGFDWEVGALLRRTALMGPHAMPYPGL